MMDKVCDGRCLMCSLGRAAQDDLPLGCAAEMGIGKEKLKNDLKTCAASTEVMDIGTRWSSGDANQEKGKERVEEKKSLDERLGRKGQDGGELEGGSGGGLPGV